MEARTDSRGPANSAEATLDLQDRIARFARLAFAVAGTMFLIARIVDFAAPDGPGLGSLVTPTRLAHEVALLLLLVAWRRCRGSALRKRTLEWLDAALTIAICFIWALRAGYGGGSQFPLSFSMVLAVTHTLVGRSVVVPSTFRRTLWISVVSVAPTIFDIANDGMSFSPGAPPDRVRVFTLFATLWCGVAVIMAAVNSKTLYGLRKQIIEIGKLGQYTLEEKIGEGGMGVVYRATHAMLRRPAAIKLLLPERAGEKNLARFEREVQHTSRLSHPNTISIFDYGRTADGVFYYVMEYLDGMDLDRLVENEGPVEPARAIHILVQVSGSLAEAHALGLVHRDIKPANIVLTERVDEPDVVKVVDFGLVKTMESTGDAAVTNANTITGTPMYLAPEAITSPDSIDARSDLYAVGAVGYFMLTGRHVFEGATVLEVCGKHMLAQPIPPSERLGKPLPADLEAIILACLAKNRDERPASAQALRASLLACEHAARYDMPAARTWWRNRGASLRASAKPPQGSSLRPETVAIDLRRRQDEVVGSLVD